MYMREATRDAAVSGPWREALRLFDRDLAVRSAAEATRKAYANDVGQLADWASTQGRDPTDEMGPPVAEVRCCS